MSPDSPLLPEGRANHEAPNPACPRTAPFSQKAGRTTSSRVQNMPTEKTAFVSGRPPSPRRLGKPSDTASRPPCGSSAQSSARDQTAPSPSRPGDPLALHERKRPKSGAFALRTPRAPPRLRTAPFSQKAGQAMARTRPAPLSRTHRLRQPIIAKPHPCRAGRAILAKNARSSTAVTAKQQRMHFRSHGLRLTCSDCGRQVAFASRRSHAGHTLDGVTAIFAGHRNTKGKHRHQIRRRGWEPRLCFARCTTSPGMTGAQWKTATGAPWLPSCARPVRGCPRARVCSVGNGSHRPGQPLGPGLPACTRQQRRGSEGGPFSHDAGRDCVEKRKVRGLNRSDHSSSSDRGGPRTHICSFATAPTLCHELPARQERMVQQGG